MKISIYLSLAAFLFILTINQIAEGQRSTRGLQGSQAIFLPLPLLLLLLETLKGSLVSELRQMAILH